MRLNQMKFRAKRWLSRYPRLKRLASVIRRRVLPMWRRGVAAAQHWDAQVEKVESAAPQGWLDLEMVEREHIRPLISGDPEIGYLQYFVDRHLPKRPVQRLLSLGCGGGNLERALLWLDAAEAIDGYDESPASIGLARQLAEQGGMGEQLHYAVADLNQVELEPASYDAIVIKMALHHFEALEHVYPQIRHALRPGGLLMFNEFIGPTRFQWTDLQLKHMNYLLETLPESVRLNIPTLHIGRPLVEDMIAQDPSESVRSAEIMPLLEHDFEIVERKDYGGTLLHMLLAYALPALDLEDENHLTFLRLAMRYERTLLEEGVLASDFAFVVARPRGTVASMGGDRI